MKIIFFAFFFAALLTPSFSAKSDEETAECIAKMLQAAISAGLSTDNTCSNCIGNCAVGTYTSTSNTFEGYTGSCVDACICTGANSAYVDAAKSDACASSFRLILGMTTVIMAILMAILI